MSEERYGADPSELKTFSEEWLERVAGLRLRAEGLMDTLANLRSAGATSDHLRSIGGHYEENLYELLDDWSDMESRAGRVADGFFALLGEGRAAYRNGTLTVDADLLTNWVGYNDRQDAIDAAHEAADLLREMRDGGRIDPEAIESIMEHMTQGQRDPVFAVAFSEAVGVEGAADLVAMLRWAAPPLDSSGAEMAELLEVCGTTLTTALDTLPDVPAAQRIDPANTYLPDDQRLSQDFVDQLVSDYRPWPLEGVDEELTFPETTDQDLSALLRYTDPPTRLAVEIANERLSPHLDAEYIDLDYLTPHGLSPPPGEEFAGVVTNYATMLSRNPAAATRWLDSDPHGDGHNIEAVLQRDTAHDIDGGEALATIVQHGLTNLNDDTRRRQLMSEAIDTIGAQEEIPNPFLYNALAAGIETNPDVLHDRINELEDGEWELTDRLQHTANFLRELMADDVAKRRVRQAVDHHIQRELETWFAAGDLDDTLPLESFGRTNILVALVDGNAAIADAEEYLANQQSNAAILDWGIAQIPFSGTAGTVIGYIKKFNSAPGSLSFSLGDLVVGTDESLEDLAEAEAIDLIGQAERNHRAMLAVAAYETGMWTPQAVLEAAAIDPSEVDRAIEQAQQDGDHALADELAAVEWDSVDFFTGEPGDEHRSIKPLRAMSPAEQVLFLNWVHSPQAAGTREREGELLHQVQAIDSGATREVVLQLFRDT